MKPTYTITLVAALFAIGTFINTATLVNSAPPPPPEIAYKHDVVILQGRSMGLSFSVGDPASCGNGFKYDGIDLYNFTSSSNAPTFKLVTEWNCPPPGYEIPPRIPMAQAIADLLDQGFAERPIDASTVLMVRKVRK